MVDSWMDTVESFSFVVVYINKVTFFSNVFFLS